MDVTGRGADRRANAHIVLETEESSSATFILNHSGSAQYAQNVEMIAGDNSQMTVITLHDWDDDALHIATHHARVGRDAKLKHVAVTLGGSAVRLNSIGEYAAPGGEIEKLGLDFADDNEFFENRPLHHDSAPQCTSNVAYKGALQEEGPIGVGRRRADPARRPRAPTPTSSTATCCSPRCARQLGAEPRDRDR